MSDTNRSENAQRFAYLEASAQQPFKKLHGGLSFLDLPSHARDRVYEHYLEEYDFHLGCGGEHWKDIHIFSIQRTVREEARMVFLKVVAVSIRHEDFSQLRLTPLTTTTPFWRWATPQMTQLVSHGQGEIYYRYGMPLPRNIDNLCRFTSLKRFEGSVSLEFPGPLYMSLRLSNPNWPISLEEVHRNLSRTALRVCFGVSELSRSMAVPRDCEVVHRLTATAKVTAFVSDSDLIRLQPLFIATLTTTNDNFVDRACRVESIEPKHLTGRIWYSWLCFQMHDYYDYAIQDASWVERSKEIMKRDLHDEVTEAIEEERAKE